ncbi:hypothetical protein [Rhodopirellula europaea]|uniref:hypothetical protein n=1 Tax=Rhodopirellula europaea TaxID=1263866 RepID=UPI0030ECD2E6
MFGRLSWQLQSRWTEPPKQVTTYIASKKTLHRFGHTGTAKLAHSFQMGHDLGLSDVFVWYFRNCPSAIGTWFGEDRLTRNAGKRPDAVLAETATTRPTKVIEFGGSYNAKRVEEFHKSCEQNKLEYELW